MHVDVQSLRTCTSILVSMCRSKGEAHNLKKICVSRPYLCEQQRCRGGTDQRAKAHNLITIRIQGPTTTAAPATTTTAAPATVTGAQQLPLQHRLAGAKLEVRSCVQCWEQPVTTTPIASAAS